MNNPWDKELTPLVDSNAGYYDNNSWVQCKSGDEVDSSFARRLERRLRYAEKLLQEHMQENSPSWTLTGGVVHQTRIYLESAIKEDKESQSEPPRFWNYQKP